MRCTLVVLLASAGSMALMAGCEQLGNGPGPQPRPLPSVAGGVRVVNVQTEAVDHDLALQRGMAMDVAAGGDGALIAAAGSDGTLRLWQADSGEAVANADLATRGRALTAVAFSGDSALVVAGNSTGKLFVFNAGGKKTFEVQAHDSGITALAALDADDLVASTDQNGVLKVWDVAKGGLVRAQGVVANGGAVYALAVSVNAARVATAGVDGKIRIWDVNGGLKALVPAAEVEAGVQCLAFNASGELLAAGLANGTVKLFDVTKNALSRGTLTGAKNPIVGVAFSGENELVVGCSKGCLKQLDTKGALIKELPKSDAMRALALTGGKVVIGR